MSISEDIKYTGGYHEYIWGCSVHWADIMMHVGDIMSTTGDFSTSGFSI